MSRKIGNRARAKGRSERGRFLALPIAVLESENFRRCPPSAKALLLDIGAQYRGSNNGDLSATWDQMRPRGWRSKSTLDAAKKALVHFGIVEVTRQGGKHRPTLYALTWEAIDDRKGKLDVPATRVASGLWRKLVPPQDARRKEMEVRNPYQCAPEIGSIEG